MTYAKIQLRRDTSANWATNNPTLALGEPGLDTGQGDDTLKKLANGEFAVILINKWKGAAGAGKYKVYGVDGGLRIAAGTVIDPWADTEGVTTVTLESQDASLENYPQYTIYKTDEATTDAIYTALKTAAS